MKKQNKSGIWLSGESPQTGAIDVSLMLSCGVITCAAAWMTGHPYPLIPAAVGLATGFFGKRQWFYPAALGSMLLLLLFFRKLIAAGFCQWYNAMGDVCTAGTGMVLRALEVTDGSLTALVLFSVLCGIAAGMLTCMAARHGVLPVSAALVLTAISVLLGREPMVPAILLCVLLLSGKKGWIGTLAVIVLLFLMFRLPGAADWAQGQRARIYDAIHDARYETKYTTLPEGQDPDGSLSESKAPALVVTMEKPERLYLRGFTGAVLRDGAWNPLDGQTLAEHEALLYWLNVRQFDLRTQFAAAAACVETQTNTVTVQNIGACSAYRYVPFTLCPDAKLCPENLHDHAQSDGGRYDVFTTVYQGAAALPELLEALEVSDDAVENYRRAEAAYREFVTRHYLDVPAAATDSLQTHWQQAQHHDPQTAVLAALEAMFPQGAENSPRYASAAVLTLRHFGIPARYAEGYIVPESTEASFQVDSSCAACWAEVYHDGIGWIPMALTPGLDEDSRTQEQTEPSEQEPEETQPQETVPQSEPEETGGWQVRVEQLLQGGLAIAVGLLLMALLLLLLWRAVRLKKRRARFEQANPREAVTWIFADSIALLERMGIHRGSGSLSEMTAPIRARFGADYTEAFLAGAALNEKALFSSRHMTEDERQAALRFHRQTLELLKSSAKWYHKLWMQVVLCLY